jgi:uncharacterized peroxidase-related enzyme
MQRLPAIDPQTAGGETRLVLDEVEARVGTSPNVVRTIANSPTALRGYLALDRELASGTLDPQFRELVAIAVAGANACDYCAAAHAAAAIRLGLDAEVVRAARQARSADPRVEAALQFARTIAEYRGDITDEEFDRMRRAGYTHQEIAEIIANVVLCVYANYFNSVARTEIDIHV